MAMTMERREVWRHTVDQRVALEEVLRDLCPEEWDHDSMCAGWRVRDVAAHLISGPQMRVANTARAMGGAWRGYNGMILLDGRRRGGAPVADILAQYERWARVPRGPITVTHVEPLIDAIVHTQDVARPLGRTVPVPPEAAAVAADRVRALAFLFGTRRFLSGVRMVATDTDWVRGRGPEVRAPMLDLLLLCAGRPVPDHAGG
jgi:uncharacterized protein (TIGR03083 family)